MSAPKSLIHSPGNPFNEEPLEITLANVFRILSYRKTLVCICVLGCFLAAIGYLYSRPTPYEAISTLQASSPITLVGFQEVAEETINSLHLMDRPEFKGLSEQSLMEGLLKNILVENNKDTNIITIRAQAHDPQLAADLANAWAPHLIQVNLDMWNESAKTDYKIVYDELKEINQKSNQNKPNGRDIDDEFEKFRYEMILQQDQDILAKAQNLSIVVVDKALVPEKVTKPKKSKVLLLGLFFGFCVGALAAFSLEKIKDKVRVEDDLRVLSGLAHLAVIPDFSRGKRKDSVSPAGRLSPGDLTDNPEFEYSPYRESFSLLSAELAAFQTDKELQAISVFSSNPGEGTTLVNANLALTLSQMGKKVLLVDANLRKSSVNLLFNLSVSPEAGLSQVLSGKKKIGDAAVKSGYENLWLLPNHVIPSNPSVLLGSESMKKLIHDLKKQYDYVIVDGAPILPVADSVVLSRFLDGVIIMARYGKTRKAEFHKAFNLLKDVNAPLFGTLLNGADIKNNEDVYGNVPKKA